MKTLDIFAAICWAFTFVAWPIVGKFVHATGAWMATIVFAANAIVIGLLFRYDLSAPPTIKVILILFAAGAMNGIGAYFYAQKLADIRISTSALVVLVSILMVVWAPIIDWILNGSIPSVRQGTGFIVAALAVWLLGK